MMSKEQIKKEIDSHKKLEAYCTKVHDSQEARKHRAYTEAYTIVLGDD